MWRFTLILEGRDLLAGDALDRLIDAGCNDASFGWVGGKQEAGFDREAETLEEAVRSAVLAVESNGGI